MSLEFVRRWYESIPPAERHLPLVILDGKAYSPERVLREVEAGTELGRRLQAKLETGQFTTEAELKQLAKIRLLEILKYLPPEYGVASFSGRFLTKEDLIKMIEQEKDLGKELIESEIQRIKSYLYGR